MRQVPANDQESADNSAVARKVQRIVMDVDTGVDDALAILLALHSPSLDIIGITTVSGNISSRQASLNTRFLLNRFGREDIPVVTGAAESLDGRKPSPVPEIHGADGLGGFSEAYWCRNDTKFGASTFDTDAVEFLLKHVKQHGKQLRIIATGPLTNIANALRKDPETMRAAGGIDIMGGAIETPGNMARGIAEFNVFFDPNALVEVLSSAIPITLFPLDVTERVRLLDRSLTDDLRIGDDTRDFIRNITKTYFDFHKTNYGFRGCFTHDALPVAYLIDPSLFSIRAGEISVDPSSSKRAGNTHWSRPGETGTRVNVAMGIDDQRFFELYWKQLRQPPKRRIRW